MRERVRKFQEKSPLKARSPGDIEIILLILLPALGVLFWVGTGLQGNDSVLWAILLLDLGRNIHGSVEKCSKNGELGCWSVMYILALHFLHGRAVSLW